MLLSSKKRPVKLFKKNKITRISTLKKEQMAMMIDDTR